VVRCTSWPTTRTRAFADQTDRRELTNITAGMTAAGKKKFTDLWEAEKKLPVKQDSVFYFDPSKSYAWSAARESYESKSCR